MLVRMVAITARPTSAVPFHRGDLGGLALLHPAVDVLADDDRIVDDHPEDHDQREHRDHVHGHAQAPRDDDPAEEGQRDPERGDEGHPRAEEEQQREQHQDRADRARVEHGPQAVLDVDREVAVRADPHARRHLARAGGHVLVHGAGDVDRVAAGALLHLHVHARPAVEAAARAAPLLRLGHLGEPVQPHLGAGRRDPHRDRREIPGPLHVAADPQETLLLLGDQRAQGRLGDAHGDRALHVGEGEPVALQGVRVHLDPEARLDEPGGLHVRDPGSASSPRASSSARRFRVSGSALP